MPELFDPKENNEDDNPPAGEDLGLGDNVEVYDVHRYADLPDGGQYNPYAFELEENPQKLLPAETETPYVGPDGRHKSDDETKL